MSDTCCCSHDLDEHPGFGRCQGTLPGSWEPLYRYCPCGGFERDNQEAV